MSIDIASLANAAANDAPDMTVAQTGGGGGAYVPPAEGIARARLVGYVETGSHERSIGAGKPKVAKPTVLLVFELSGPNHAPKVLDDGTKLPHRLTVDLNYSLNEKAGFYKLFKRMNWEGKAKHMSQLLGQAFLVTVKHTVTGEGDKKRTYADIRDESGYLLTPPRYVDPMTNQTIDVPVDPPISPLRLFVWNAADELLKPMWDTLFIDGEYPAHGDRPAKSKNVLQDAIKSALNFKDSPIFRLLQTGGVELRLGADPLSNTGPAKADQGVVGGSVAAVAGTAAAPLAAASATGSVVPAASNDPLANI